MDRPAVHVIGSPIPGGQSVKGIYLDGTTVEVTMRNLEPSHDPALGVYYTDVNGTRWKPLHDVRLTASGEYAGGPGWFEPLDDDAALTPEGTAK